MHRQVGRCVLNVPHTSLDLLRGSPARNLPRVRQQFLRDYDFAGFLPACANFLLSRSRL